MDSAILRNGLEGSPGLVSEATGRIPGGSFEPQILRTPPRVRLAQFAKEAAQTCAEQPQVTHFRFQGDGPHLSREMLGLLTFSYATGLLTLERIYSQMNEDALLFSFLGGPKPHPATLRAFRRMERRSVLSSLDRFLEITLDFVQTQAEGAPEERGVWLRSIGLVSDPDSPTRSKWIQDRINQATWVDRMMLDF